MNNFRKIQPTQTDPSRRSLNQQIRGRTISQKKKGNYQRPAKKQNNKQSSRLKDFTHKTDHKRRHNLMLLNLFQKIEGKLPNSCHQASVTMTSESSKDYIKKMLTPLQTNLTVDYRLIDAKINKILVNTTKYQFKIMFRPCEDNST